MAALTKFICEPTATSANDPFCIKRNVLTSVFAPRFPPNVPPYPPYTVCKHHITTSLKKTIFSDPCLFFSGDFFPASYNCPHEIERIGAFGDGGKWVCGLSRIVEKPDCVIYSFGELLNDQNICLRVLISATRRQRRVFLRGRTAYSDKSLPSLGLRLLRQ